jgi:hypothetical protein
MQACYAEDAQFDDEVFTLAAAPDRRHVAHAVHGHARQGPRRLEAGDTRHHRPQRALGRALPFSATGRWCINRIDAEFEFDKHGLILRHRDRFDFWAWSRQALGVPGLILGWTPLFRKQVQAQGRGQPAPLLDKA